MNKNYFAFVAVFILAGYFGASPVSSDVFTDETKAEILYGKGVHAFFDGEFHEAADLLAQVENLKSEDPRPYYFLALANRRLGNMEAADKFFKTAARLEVEGRSARDFKISETLRRIQGRERLVVEEYRKEAWRNWEKEEKRRQSILFGAQKTKDEEIVAKLATPVIATAPFGAVSVNPFGATVSIEQAVTAPTAKTAPEEKKTPTGKAEKVKPVDDDPFGASEDEAEPEKKSEKKSDGEMDDDDPFAESAETKKKEDDKKKETDDDDDDDDPFQ